MSQLESEARLSDAEMTRIIKSTLRQTFPDHKFTVTTSHGRIEWVDDGPTIAQVSDVLVPALGAELKSWRDHRTNEEHFYLDRDRRSLSLHRYNMAARAAAADDLARRIQEGEARRQRENEAVHEAAKLREAALARPPSPSPLVESAPEAFKAFDDQPPAPSATPSRMTTPSANAGRRADGL